MLRKTKKTVWKLSDSETNGQFNYMIFSLNLNNATWKKSGKKRKEKKNANFEKDSCLSWVSMVTLMVAHMYTPRWF